MRRVAIGLGVLCGVLWLQQAPLWHWIVEDAAISFTFARNLVDGHGLVPFPGGERVEGYSNPLWVALLAWAYAMGLDLFSTARVLGAVCSAATLVLVWQAARTWFPERPVVAWAAATVVALDPQHVIWGTSGLENSLFSALLAAGVWRTGADRPGAPWAPLCFLGLALTRPEGGAYALLAGATALVRGGRAGAGAVVAGWIRWALLPLLAIHAVRFVYFARELPATYYAKLGDSPFQNRWSGPGWAYLRRWGWATGAWMWLPVGLFGLLGSRGWRLWVVGASAAVVALALLGPASVTGEVRVWLLMGGVVVLPLASAGEHRAARVLTWAMAALVLGFAVRAGGDWMRGYRWLSLGTVPLALLLGMGIDEVHARLPARRPLQLGLVVVALAVWLIPRQVHLDDLTTDQVASPWGVRNRLRHYQKVLRRDLWLDRRLVVLDHDMGGLMYWGGDDLVIHDARGLVDLPFALHRSNPRFVTDYLFRPGVDHPDLGPPPTVDMAHAHASTLRATRRVPAFKRGFVEVPGYGNPADPHGGQMLAEAVLLHDDWDGPEISVGWPDLELRGVRVPSPETTPGSGLYVEVALTAADAPSRLVGVLAGPDGVAEVWDLPLALELVPTHEWHGRVFVGRYALAVDPEVPQGEYHLRLAVLGPDGSVVPPTSVQAPAQVGDAPVWAEGEVRLPGVVRLVSPDRMNELAAEDRQQALEQAAGRRCVSAEQAWERALRHRTRSGPWRDRNRPEVAEALARCWAERAARHDRSGEALMLRVRELEHARSWDPGCEAVWTQAHVVAAEAWSRGLIARRDGDAEASFQWFDAAVRALPTLSWARRYAEQARVERLGLPPIEGPHWPFDPPRGPQR